MRVVDASIAVKWFKPDEKLAAADLLVEEHSAGKEILFAPTLVLYEFTNALYNSKKLTPTEIITAVSRLYAIGINMINPTLEIWPYVLDVMSGTQTSLYDASYIALASYLHCPLVTADKKLYQRAHRTIDMQLL
jgi:predicted nucleic acid-binding protein